MCEKDHGVPFHRKDILHNRPHILDLNEGIITWICIWRSQDDHTAAVSFVS